MLYFSIWIKFFLIFFWNFLQHNLLLLRWTSFMPRSFASCRVCYWSLAGCYYTKNLKINWSKTTTIHHFQWLLDCADVIAYRLQAHNLLQYLLVDELKQFKKKIGFSLKKIKKNILNCRFFWFGWIKNGAYGSLILRKNSINLKNRWLFYCTFRRCFF